MLVETQGDSISPALGGWKILMNCMTNPYVPPHVFPTIPSPQKSLRNKDRVGILHFSPCLEGIWGVEGLARVTVKDMSPGLQRTAELTHQPAQVGLRGQTSGEVHSLPEQLMFAEL